MGKVFISYSHDSKEHKIKVRSFANKLRSDGIDCVIDQYVNNPSIGWPRWIDRNVDQADYVIIVCTQKYYNRTMGYEPKGKGKGVKWESNLIYQEIYDSDTEQSKYIAVLFNGISSKLIPPPLRGRSFYKVETKEGYDNLVKYLTNQQAEIPELGKIPIFGQAETPDWEFKEEESSESDDQPSNPTQKTHSSNKGQATYTDSSKKKEKKADPEFQNEENSQTGKDISNSSQNTYVSNQTTSPILEFSKKEIEELIINNYTEEAIDKLQAYFESAGQARLKSQILLLAADYQKIKQKERMNMLSYGEVRVAQNQIISSILEMVEGIS